MPVLYSYLELNDLKSTAYVYDSSYIHCDLTLYVYEREGYLQCNWSTNKDIFSAEFLDRLKSSFLQLIRDTLENPSKKVYDLCMIGEQEQIKIALAGLLATMLDKQEDSASLF